MRDAPARALPGTVLRGRMYGTATHKSTAKYRKTRAGGVLDPPPPSDHLPASLPDTVERPPCGWRGGGGQCRAPFKGGWQGCIGREGISEAAPEAVRQAVGGGCQSGWGRLPSVTNATKAGIWREGDSGWASVGRPEGRGGYPPPLQCIPLGGGGGGWHKALALGGGGEWGGGVPPAPRWC